MPLIFVIDGVLKRSGFARTTLEQAGYQVRTFASSQVLRTTEQNSPNLALIAAQLPDGSGIDLLAKIQDSPALRRTKVVLMGDRADGALLVTAASADAFIDDVFTQSELLACVDSVLNDLVPPPSSASPSDAEILIDSSAMRVKVLGNELTTTTLEFRLIEYMARHRGKVFTRDALLDAVWGDLHFVNPRTVDACVGRIRRKINHIRYAPAYLKTIRGVGYKLDAKAAWESTSNQFCNCASCLQLRMRARTGTGGRSHRTSA